MSDRRYERHSHGEDRNRHPQQRRDDRNGGRQSGGGGGPSRSHRDDRPHHYHTQPYDRHDSHERDRYRGDNRGKEGSQHRRDAHSDRRDHHEATQYDYSPSSATRSSSQGPGPQSTPQTQPLSSSSSSLRHSSSQLHPSPSSASTPSASQSAANSLSSSQSRPVTTPASSTASLSALAAATPAHQTYMIYRQLLSPETISPGVPQEVYKYYQDVAVALGKADAFEDQSVSHAIGAVVARHKLADITHESAAQLAKYLEIDFRDRTLLGDLDAVHERRRQLTEEGTAGTIHWQMGMTEPL